VDRYHRANGDVAVLISPGFGAGWSTWASEDETEKFLYDPLVVQKVLDSEEITEKWLMDIGYEGYTGGRKQLIVEWLAPGTRFRVEEYDGSESLVTQEHLPHTA
jgi:hypothetical protein